MAALTEELVLPRSVEAEMSLLGAMLLDTECCRRGIEELRDQDFYLLAHILVFRAIARVAQRGENVDLVTVSNELEGAGRPDEAGGSVYLTKLAESVPTVWHFSDYLALVKEKAALRDTIRAATTLIHKAAGGSKPLELIADAKAIPELLDASTHLAYDREALFHRAVHELEARDEPGAHIRIGIRALDEALHGGMLRGELLVLSGYPNMGKTPLALWMVRQALRDGHRCLFLSYEMSDYALVHRMLAQDLRIPGDKFRRGKHALDGEEWAGIMAWCQDNLEKPLFVMDSRVSPMRFPAIFRATEPDLVVIDTIQHCPHLTKAQDERAFLEWFMPFLVDLARGRVIVAVSHIRKPDTDALPRPSLMAMKGSAAIAQFADAVIFIHRERDAMDTLVTRVKIAKQREGEVTLGWPPIDFEGSILSFQEQEWRKSLLMSPEGQGDNDR